VKKTFALCAVLLFLIAVPVLAAPVNMQAGNWEIVTRISIEGVPFPMPPMKITHCYTKKDLEDGSKTRPAAGGSGKKDDCEAKDVVERGNSASWKLVCKDGTSGTGEASYKGTEYTVTQKLVGKDGSGASTTTIKAKRIGDCK
jgi:hypothetical protein